MSVSSWFQQFCTNIQISNDNVSTIAYRYKRITSQLNANYWNNNASETANSLYVGSYGRDTDIHVSDIDMIFRLPWDKHTQYNNHSGNGQSALIQEVKNIVLKTYSRTSVRGDGQVVVVEFSDDIRFELVPVFAYTDGSFCYPDTNNGGSWKTTNPKPEIQAIKEANDNWNKNLKRLCRMARAWKDNNNVNIKGILIDTLAYHFMSGWSYTDKSYLYYDYMSRDFFAYLYEARNNYSGWEIPGSKETIYRDGVFTSKAKSAYDLCLLAIQKEKDYPTTAKRHWREIYGAEFPA
ncbi:nucleotidyltransferase [Spirosoma sp. HMF4905]|uniref:Nucleotidyltransferase n=1 Tax=Spirosoma arboris TaxID=2682092 RepID=A0A7K1SHX6_9BACT|nr:nucleotidyltransferase [Spirosoma arboris]MVM33402.1 nucleotidyltransferase [Spirosoma arboris]